MSAPTVKCPRCREPVEWSESAPFRPFCSQRCKMIDFGDWASEQHSIPGEPVWIPEDMDTPPAGGTD